MDGENLTYYEGWISRRLAGKIGYGDCREVCQDMVDQFPDLDLCRGIFHSIAWGNRQHWWCATAGGKIVDPTARQHPDGAIFPEDDSRYTDLTNVTEEEAIELGHIPTGKCPECGEEFYHPRRDFCSDECRSSFEAEANSWLR